MPITNEEALRDRLAEVVEDEKGSGEYHDKLNEKGVECAIILPIVEILWGFDALKDVEYESSSKERNDQRFDLLIENRFLVESKKLGVDLEQMKKQVEGYIISNNNINYGVLTNGFEYIFFLQKSFIKGFLGPEKEMGIPIGRDVIPVLTITIDDHDNFIPIMKLFAKGLYDHQFRRIAEFVLSVHNQGKVWQLTTDSKVNDVLKQKIKDELDIKKGVFLSDIQKGDRRIGDVLVFKTDDLSISISREPDGRVRLPKNGAVILNMNNVLNSDFRPMIELVMHDWSTHDTYFDDPYDIIRQALGKKKLHRKDKYSFLPA